MEKGVTVKKSKIMKSKSFDAGSISKDQTNKSFDFLTLYKSAAETSAVLSKSADGVDKENNFTPSAKAISRDRSNNKNKKNNKNEPLDISQINIDGSSLDIIANKSTPAKGQKVTSTPYNDKKSKANVKSIMKSPSQSQASENLEATFEDAGKRKKRNKSVSFMLEDHDEVASKKSKSDDSTSDGSITKSKKSKNKNKKIDNETNKNVPVKQTVTTEQETRSTVQDRKQEKLKNKKLTKQVKVDVESGNNVPEALTVKEDSAGDSSKKEKKKWLKKNKNIIVTDKESTSNDNNNIENPNVNKEKKIKKKKRHISNSENIPEVPSAEGEPKTKSQKKEVKPEVIVQDLENLNIGDNTHTLTNLLDDMSVTSKSKKKNKHGKEKLGKSKKQKLNSQSSSESADLEKIEEGKEKVKWNKRKWNKDKKGDLNDDGLLTSVIVDNLLLKHMLTYRNLLSEHFGQFGLIKKIGVAEVYPTEEPKPVFTTTIFFDSEGAATKALEEDNSLIEGSRIRVRRPLPPTETTLVVRSHGDLSEQALSSTFTGAGRIRHIRHLLKGKKSIATAFIEFDGPEAVARAMKLAEEARIGGKKMYISRFEVRRSKKKTSSQDAEKKNEDHSSSDEN